MADQDQWHRRRRPDEVPTPVAVAVSDFCRRARAPAPAAEIRDALSLLSGDEDFRVTSVTDAEPAAQPLGPEIRAELQALAVQHRHRIALQKALVQQFQSRGKPPSEDELREALERHGLLEELERRERELVLGSYAEQRGAAGRVAWALD